MQTEFDMDESFSTVEYLDGDDVSEPGWYILMVDEFGEEHDRIGPFGSEADAETADDMMQFEEAA